MAQTVQDGIRQSVMDDLNRIHDAVAQTPQEHTVARHKAFASAIRTAVGSVAVGLGWKAFSEFSDSRSRAAMRDAGNGATYRRLENDFLMAGIKKDGPNLFGMIGVNMRNFLPRMAEGAAHVADKLQSLDFWKRSLNELKAGHAANPKKTYIIAGVVTGLSVLAGIHRYFKERIRMQNENAHEISSAVHSITQTVQENPAIIEDPAVAAMLKDRLTHVNRGSTPNGWTDNMKAVRQALEEQGVVNSR